MREHDSIEELKRFILERTQGNPFFMEEMVQALFEQDVLVRNGAIKVARPLAQVHLPPGVQGILASRIDRLPAPEKELLQTLAVIGREFPLGLIRGVTRTSTEELEGMLGDLQLGEFIYEQPVFPEVEYKFKHALTQEVAYNSVLLGRRKILHERAGAAIESLYAGLLEDHLDKLAHHYSHSNNIAKAIEYLRRAGQQAASRALFEEAVNQLHGALELLPKLEPASARDLQEFAIRMALLAPMNAIHSIAAPENQQNLLRARMLCEELGESQLLAQLLLYLFFVHWSIRDFGVAKEFAEQAMDLAERAPQEIAIFTANFVTGVVAETRGDFLSARRHLERALAVSDETHEALLKNPDTSLGLINCTGMLGLVLWILGYPDQALQQHERMASLLDKPIDALAHSLGVCHVLGMHCDLLRDYRGMRAYAERLVARCRENGLAWQTPIALIWLGRLMVADAEVDSGIETVTEGMSALKALGEITTHDSVSYVQLVAYLGARRAAEGLLIAEQAIAKCSAGSVRVYEADLHRLKGELLLLAGTPESEAEASMRQAIAIAQRQEAKGWVLRGATSLARLLRKQGRMGEARDALAPVYNWFTEGFDMADLKDARALLDELKA